MNLNNEIVSGEVTMNNRMECSRFIVLIKVEQINDDLLLNTYQTENCVDE